METGRTQPAFVSCGAAGADLQIRVKHPI